MLSTSTNQHPDHGFEAISDQIWLSLRVYVSMKQPKVVQQRLHWQRKRDSVVGTKTDNGPTTRHHSMKMVSVLAMRRGVWLRRWRILHMGRGNGVRMGYITRRKMQAHVSREKPKEGVATYPLAIPWTHNLLFSLHKQTYSRIAMGHNFIARYFCQ